MSEEENKTGMGVVGGGKKSSHILNRHEACGMCGLAERTPIVVRGCVLHVHWQRAGRQQKKGRRKKKKKQSRAAFAFGNAIVTFH